MEQPAQEKRPVYRIVSEAYSTRYAELSAHYDEDCIWNGAIQQTMVAFGGDDSVTLYRLHSDGAPTKLTLTQEEAMLFSLASADYLLKEESVGQYCDAAVVDASIAIYTAYLEALKAVSQRLHAGEETLLRDPFDDDPLDSLNDHPF